MVSKLSFKPKNRPSTDTFDKPSTKMSKVDSFYLFLKIEKKLGNACKNFIKCLLKVELCLI